MTNKTWFHEGDETTHCGRQFTRANTGLCPTQTRRPEKLKVDYGCNQDTKEPWDWTGEEKWTGQGQNSGK